VVENRQRYAYTTGPLSPSLYWFTFVLLKGILDTGSTARWITLTRRKEKANANIYFYAL